MVRLCLSRDPLTDPPSAGVAPLVRFSDAERAQLKGKHGIDIRELTDDDLGPLPPRVPFWERRRQRREQWRVRE